MYKNAYNTSKYAYARPYTTSMTVGEYRQIMTEERTQFVDIYIVGVADGVSPKVHETMIPVGTPRRLYIFSDTPLDEITLSAAESYYKEHRYPLLSLITPCAHLDRDRVPMQNFYAALAGHDRADEIEAAVFCRQDAMFIEYRYAQQRHEAANIYYDEHTNKVYRLALPADSAMLVLIMPYNFVRTGLKQGYFLFDNIDLMVRVYSKHLLSASQTSDNAGEVLVNDICTGNQRIMEIIRTFYTRMGVHNVYTPSDNQIVGYDKYLTLVVGDVSNINV